MKLFVLDNDRGFLRAWTAVLRGKGYDVDSARSPDERTPADVNGTGYDLALIDLRARDDSREDDWSGFEFAAALRRLGTPTAILTGFPPPALVMSTMVRQGDVAGFVLKALPTWQLVELVNQFWRTKLFPNGIAEFRRSDRQIKLGPIGLWRSVRAELTDAAPWARPPYAEFSTLFRSLFPAPVTDVGLRAVTGGQSPAALLRADVSSGDALVSEELAVKFGKKSVIRDEMMRYDRFVGPLPDGAAAQLRYRAETENLAAIAYSWVGDSIEEGTPLSLPSSPGQGSPVTWGQRRATIAKLFSRALNTWYDTFRRSRWCAIRYCAWNHGSRRVWGRSG